MKFRFPRIDDGIAQLICIAVLGTSCTYASAFKPSPQKQAPATPPPRRSMREIVNMPVVYRVPGMDKVSVKTNLKYTTANDPNLLMDVYTPPGLAKGERRPAVVFIHGGAGSAFKPKDWGIYQSWGR